MMCSNVSKKKEPHHLYRLVNAVWARKVAMGRKYMDLALIWNIC